jgi:hypothetical protein
MIIPGGAPSALRAEVGASHGVIVGSTVDRHGNRVWRDAAALTGSHIAAGTTASFRLHAGICSGKHPLWSGNHVVQPGDFGT